LYKIIQLVLPCEMHLDFLLFPLIVADYDLNTSRKFVRWDY